MLPLRSGNSITLDTDLKITEFTGSVPLRYLTESKVTDLVIDMKKITAIVLKKGGTFAVAPRAAESTVTFTVHLFFTGGRRARSLFPFVPYVEMLPCSESGGFFSCEGAFFVPPSYKGCIA